MARQGLFNAPNSIFWAYCRKYALSIGLAGSVLANHFYFQSATAHFSSTEWISTAINTLFASITALGLAGWIAWYAAQPPTRFTYFVARAGGASLSVYILQSVILSFIFYGYGLAKFNTLTTLPVVGIALMTGVASISLVSRWRYYFPNGPLEILLRWWTYRGDR